MSKRCIYFCHGLAALIVGVGSYLLFRHGTFLNIMLGVVGPFSHSKFFGMNLLRYYASDFLWTYALCFWLAAILCPVGRQWRWVVSLAIIVGFLWEGMQWCSIAPGTADYWDCFTYFAAGMVVYIFQKRKGVRK